MDRLPVHLAQQELTPLLMLLSLVIHVTLVATHLLLGLLVVLIALPGHLLLPRDRTPVAPVVPKVITPKLLIVLPVPHALLGLTPHPLEALYVPAAQRAIIALPRVFPRTPSVRPALIVLLVPAHVRLAQLDSFLLLVLHLVLVVQPENIRHLELQVASIALLVITLDQLPQQHAQPVLKVNILLQTELQAVWNAPSVLFPVLPVLLLVQVVPLVHTPLDLHPLVQVALLVTTVVFLPVVPVLLVPLVTMLVLLVRPVA